MKIKRNNLVVVLILVIWFVISFVTNIIGPIMPSIIESYQLSLTMAAFLPFSFFLAYGIMSIPAGALVEKYGAKTAILLAFGINLTGALLFSVFPFYGMALGSLFLIGIGMAMLQVIINPLMRQAGGEEHFAFFSVMGQLVFGLASYISPFVFVYLTREVSAGTENGNFFIRILASLIPANLPWSSLYWIFSFVFFLIILITASVRFPSVLLREDEKTSPFEVYVSLFRNKKVIFYFLGIMAYVGTEQGLANWMSKFLESYHGFDPIRDGARAVSWFWGLMSLGCLVGLLLLKLMDSRLVLRIFTSLALISLGIALFGVRNLSLFAFPVTGFFLSVMFSIIFSLALNSVEKSHGAFSGILCSGIFGGALVPLIIGALGDLIGLRYAMTFIFVTLLYIMGIGFRANPVIVNKTIRLRDMIPYQRKSN